MVDTCRICLISYAKEKLKNIFQYKIKNVEDSLVDILFWIFSVEIDATDPFPKDICVSCIVFIEYILEVKTNLQKNQQKLRDDLEQKKRSCLNDGLSENTRKDTNTERNTSNTVTNSTSRNRFNKNNINGNRSPKVIVSISAIEQLCPVNINIAKFEESPEYHRYRRLANGRFKKRKYRRFNLDNTLLNDICNTLEDNTSAKRQSSKREIGVSTEYSTNSVGVNTEDINICICTKTIVTPFKNVENVSYLPLLEISPATHKLKSYGKSINNEGRFSDIIPRSVGSTFAAIKDSGEYGWANLTVRKNVSTNTDFIKKGTKTVGTNIEINQKSIGIDAKVSTVTVGTLTKSFKPSRSEKVVKVNINSFDNNFGPKVLINPLEYILEKQNYEQIDTFTYVKRYNLDQELIDEETYAEVDTANVKTNCEKTKLKNKNKSRKQKYLDYYNNFSSYAVRELIMGKNIRENDPLCKISSVHSVFVCNFCSKSFLSQASLDFHCKQGHLKYDQSKQKDMLRQKQNIRTVFKSRKQQMCSKTKTKLFLKKVRTANFNLNNVRAGKSENNVNNPTVCTASNVSVKQNLMNVLKHKVTPKTGLDKLGLVETNSLDATINKDDGKFSYAWDKKRLGKYSAISYYGRNHSNDQASGSLTRASHDINEKRDLLLNETIRKLATRLDEPENTEIV